MYIVLTYDAIHCATRTQIQITKPLVTFGSRTNLSTITMHRQMLQMIIFQTCVCVCVPPSPSLAHTPPLHAFCSAIECWHCRQMSDSILDD